MIRDVCVSAGEGKHRVRLMATLTGEGLVLSLLGGEKPHVGAVVFSIPRPSLADPRRLSCNSIVAPLVGHKDDEIAKPLAEKMAKITGQPVALAAGLHVEGATDRDIALLKQNSWHACEMLLKELGLDKISPGGEMPVPEKKKKNEPQGTSPEGTACCPGPDLEGTTSCPATEGGECPVEEDF